jgi:hypothetical protein
MVGGRLLSARSFSAGLGRGAAVERRSSVARAEPDVLTFRTG